MGDRLLASARVVPVIRASRAELAVRAGLALHRGGMRLVEITFTTPEAPVAIAALAEAGVPVGAGTVLDPEMAEQALAAGARFLVSPHCDPELLALARERGVLAIPGIATATEAVRARRAGATILKIFPAETLGGPRYLKLLRDPLPDLRFFPTGGVTLENAPAYLAAGAIAVGAASALLPSEWVEAGDERALEDSARRWCRALDIT